MLTSRHCFDCYCQSTFLLQGWSDRVRTGHGKPYLESHGILEFHFPGLKSHGIEVWVMESRGKWYCLHKIN